MDIYLAARLRAMRNVLRPDATYLIRRIHRWYSKTFHTPLREVEELPLDDLLLTYFEERYEGMDEEERLAERDDLLVTEEQRHELMMAEEADEAEMFEMAKIVAAEEAAKKKRAQQLPEKTAGSKGLIAAPPQSPGLIRGGKLPESDLPGLKPTRLPEGITMTFVTEDEFEAELRALDALKS